MLDALLVIFSVGGLVFVILAVLRKGLFATGMASYGVCMTAVGAVNLYRAFADHRGALIVATGATMAVSGATMAWLALTGRWKKRSAG